MECADSGNLTEASRRSLLFDSWICCCSKSQSVKMGNCCHKPTSSDSFSSSEDSEDSESSVAKRVRVSMVHWSQLSEAACNNDGEAAEIDNREVFKQLQSHPQYGQFFVTFGYTLEVFESMGSLEKGQKFAEGGQAELFHAHIQWSSPKGNEEDLKEGTEWVLKVFKKGTLLRHLQSQWPSGYLQFRADLCNLESEMPMPTMYCSNVSYGVLLKDGRFAFLIQKHQGDLCNLIEGRMETGVSMPFDKGVAEEIIYKIAEGMNWLHGHNIVHRDLKAANVLCTKGEGWWRNYVADYECSIGVVGTGFWRAPEILQALKDKDVRREVFTKEADVYAFGMTCYEILTGKLPFEGHPWRDFDLILLNKQRPMLPDYVDDWMRDLLSRCWEEDPTCRPSFQEIMEVLATNSISVGECQISKQQWEDDYERNWKKRRGEAQN